MHAVNAPLIKGVVLEDDRIGTGAQEMRQERLKCLNNLNASRPRVQLKGAEESLWKR